MSIEPARSDHPLSVAWAITSERQPDAFDTYRSSIADLYDVTGVRDNGRTGFRSRTTAFRFGASALGRGHSVAQTMSRGPEQIRRSRLDHISIIVNMAETLGDCDGQSVRAEAGAVQFRDLNRPSASRIDHIDTINLMTPRTSVPSWLLRRNVHGLTLPAASPGGRLVASHLKTLADVAAQLSEDEGVAAIEATFIIAERFLGNAGPLTPLHSDAIHRTIRQRAMQIFDARVRDPSVDVQGVAQAIGVSRSALYRAFGAMGGVQTYVLNRRLDRAYSALRIEGGTFAAIEHIAVRYGFSNTPIFTRAFRSRFGFAPVDVGPAGLAGRGAPPAVDAHGVLDGAVHDVVLDWLRVGEAA